MVLELLLEDTSKEVTASLVAHMLKKGNLTRDDILELYSLIEEHHENE